MSDFVLNVQLEQDCHRIAESKDSLVLLLDNALYHWFVLVPKVSSKIIELYQLDSVAQQKLFSETMSISKFIKETLRADKLNIGAIGNIVSQMHIHIVGRHHADAAWPGVVWGAEEKEGYSESTLEVLRVQFQKYCKG